MSMQMIWLDFQLSTDNQNGRDLATDLKKKKIKFPWNLVYI